MFLKLNDLASPLSPELPLPATFTNPYSHYAHHPLFINCHMSSLPMTYLHYHSNRQLLNSVFSSAFHLPNPHPHKLRPRGLCTSPFRPLPNGLRDPTRLQLPAAAQQQRRPAVHTRGHGGAAVAIGAAPASPNDLGKRLQAV